MAIIPIAVLGLLVAPLTQAPTVEDLRQLTSTDWKARSAKFAELARDADRIARDRGVRDAFVGLLEVENRESYRAFDEGLGSRKVGEGYSAYYSDLIGTVLGFAQSNDTRTLRALAFGVYNPDSALAKTLAGFGEPVVGPLLELVASDVAPRRWNGLEGLGLVLELDAARKTQVPVVPVSREKALGAIRGHLLSPDATVRLSAVRAAGAARDRGSIPMLRMLAQSDAHEIPGSAVRHPVRHEALAALRAMQGKQ